MAEERSNPETERDGDGGDGDPVPTRRSILRGIGATAAATGIPLERRGDGGLDWWDVDGSPSSDDARQGGVDPIPEAYEVEVGGETNEVPINRQIVRGSCRDLIRFVRNGGVVEPVAEYFLDQGKTPGGWTRGWYTINGTDVWPIGGEELALRGLPEEMETDRETPSLDFPVREHITIEEETKTDDVGEEYTEYRVTDLDFSFGANVEVDVLDWHPSHPVSEECRAYWCRLIREIVDHERVHVVDEYEIARDVHRKLQSMEPPSEYGDLPDDELPDVPPTLSEADGGDYPPDLARDALANRVQRLLFYYVQEAVTRSGNRAGEFHATEEGKSDVTETCEPYCENCEELDNQPLTAIDAWRLEVSYTWEAQLDATEGTQRTYREIRQTVDATFELERTEVPVVTDVLSFLNGIVSWLNGIDDFLNDLGLDVDLVPDRIGDRVGAYRGTGEISATHRELSHVESTGNDGEVNWRRTRTQGHHSGTLDGAVLSLKPEDGTYEVSWPTWEIPTTVTNTVHSGDTTRGPERSEGSTIVWTGEAAKDQSQGPILPGITGDGGEGVPDPEDVGSGDVTFSLEECGRVMSNSVQQPLKFTTQPILQRHVLSPHGDGEPIGREWLTWQIVPAGLPEGREPGHLTCPE